MTVDGPKSDMNAGLTIRLSSTEVARRIRLLQVRPSGAVSALARDNPPPQLRNRLHVVTLDTIVRAQLRVPMRGLTHDPSASYSLKVLPTFIVLGQLDCEIEKTGSSVCGHPFAYPFRIASTTVCTSNASCTVAK